MCRLGNFVFKNAAEIAASRGCDRTIIVKVREKAIKTKVSWRDWFVVIVGQRDYDLSRMEHARDSL